MNRKILFCLSLVSTLGPAAALSAPMPAVSIEERGEDGVTFIVELGELRQAPVTIEGEPFVAVGAAGFGSLSTPGLPALPFRTFTIAVPPDRDPVPQVTVLLRESLDLVPAPASEPYMERGGEEGEAIPGLRDAIDRAFYSGGEVYPALRFATGPRGWLRQQQVVDLTVYPVRYDPAAGRLEVARRLEVRVDFQPRAGRSGLPTRLPAPSFERGFESVYQNTLLNYESARRFRAGPSIEARARAIGARGVGDEIRIEVGITGPLRLTYAQLAAAGLPAGIPVADLALWERRYVDAPPPAENFVRDPLPITVEDQNRNDVFDSGDWITGFTRSYRDRVGPDPYFHRYTERNVIWLSWEEAGARIGTRPGWFEPAPPPAAASFPDTFRFEEDKIYFNYAPRTPTTPSYAAHELVLPWYLTRHFPRADLGDPYCADQQCTTFLFPYALTDVDESQPIRARAQMVSGIDNFRHLATFLISSPGREDTLVTRWGFRGHLAIGTWESDPFPAATFTRQNSSFKFVGERQSTQDTTQIFTYLGAHFDWFEFLYAHQYRARADRLLCTSGTASGPTEFRINGFSSPDVSVFDVTDPLNPVALAGVQVSASAPYEVRFRDDVTAPRRYAAFVRGSGELTVADAALRRVQPTSLASPAVEPDYIIVVPATADIDGDGTPDDFAAEAQRLKDHRESQGHRVAIARLSDIEDEFDGGLHRPLAIRNYLRHAFAHWTRPPMYLLLAGDGSEDYRNKVPTGLDVVPTQMIFGPVFGDVDLELVACDPWFVAGLAPEDGEFDRHLDMAVGRLPAQSARELRLMADKTIRYEQFDPGDRWRAKTFTIADDAWSSTISFSAQYRYRTSEEIFGRISDLIDDMVEQNSKIGDLIETRAMRLADYTDQLSPPPDRLPPHTPGEAVAHFDTTGSPLMYQLISEGNLIMNYQGHANRHLLAHERMFSSEFDRDQNSFNNLGRPGIWFVYACHPNHFNHLDERVGNVVGGRERTLGELLVSLENRGLVAAVGSTGFEWLPAGVAQGPPFQFDLNTPQWEAFFLTPPTEDPGGEPTGARWVLGEVTNLAKELYLQQDARGDMIFTYCLLGDPGLRMDAIPPLFAVSAADTVRAAGSRVESFAAGSDTVTIVAEIRDEVQIAEAQILERNDGGPIPVDPLLWNVQAPADRRRIVTYRAPLRPDNYDIIVRARDSNERTIEFPLLVRTDVSWRANGAPIASGDFVASGLDLDIAVHSPVGLDGSDFRLLLDGEPVGNIAPQSLDPLSKDWRIAASIVLTAGSHDLTLEIRHGGTLGLRSTVSVQVGGFDLTQVAVYPNPFDQFTAISYQLTSPADEVVIRIYTISGRQVQQLRGPRNVGYSQIAWDGRDADGDQVANGTYVFRVTASWPLEEDEFTGRIVRARD